MAIDLQKVGMQNMVLRLLGKAKPEWVHLASDAFLASGYGFSMKPKNYINSPCIFVGSKRRKAVLLGTAPTLQLVLPQNKILVGKWIHEIQVHVLTVFVGNLFNQSG